jgi:hypothetical protein
VALEKGVPIRANENFGGRFAGTIGILSSQRILLPKGMPSLLVPIDFIRGDENRRAGVAQLTEGLQHVGGSQSVDLVGFQRAEIGIPDQRLCCKVEHKIRATSKDGFPDFRGMAQIAEFVPKPILELQLREERGLRS